MLTPCQALGLLAALTLPISRAQPHGRSSWSVGQPVNTTSGLIHGHRASNATDVSEYLGIPYARPPIDKLRFAPPVRYTGVSNISGSEFGFSCPQSSLTVPPGTNLSVPEIAIVSAIGGISKGLNEDCLTLNIWTKPQSGAKSKPVMLWIYGGAFLNGGSSLGVYNGQYWSEDEDVVLVTVNYRLDVFGFPGAPDLTQNVGLLDQRMAVEWVRENIAGFGGDVQRITIFGESAGGGSVDFYNYIWLDDPIIHGSIIESWPTYATSGTAPFPADDQSAAWYNVTKSLGCAVDTTQSAQTVLACMRNSSRVTQEQLLTAAAEVTFGPTIDEKTVFADYQRRTEEGRIIRKPVLTGNNDNEGGIITFEAAIAGQSLPNAYEQGKEMTHNYTCSSNVQAWRRWKQKIPVWRYRYFPAFPNIDIRTSIGRAYHSAEIAPLFGTAQDVTKIASTDREKSVGDFIRHAWATFAHDPQNGLQALGWPMYSPDLDGTKGLVLLGRDKGDVAQFSARGVYDEHCPAVG